MLRWLALLLAALVTLPAHAQTEPYRPRFYAVGIAYDNEIGGVVSYRIGANGTLDGRFALHGSDGRIEQERAVPRQRGLIGSYDTSGTSMGQAYQGVLTVARIGAASRGEGDLFRLRWDNGDSGLGILHGDTLTVAYGRDADTVGMLFSILPNVWMIVAIGWRDGAERRYELGWTGTLRDGVQWVEPLGGGVAQQLRVERNGQTWRLLFDDGNYGVAMPVTAPPYTPKPIG